MNYQQKIFNLLVGATTVTSIVVIMLHGFWIFAPDFRDLIETYIIRSTYTWFWLCFLTGISKPGPPPFDFSIKQ